MHVSYSLLAVGAGLVPSENSVLLGVGDDVRRIDDVAPFGELWRVMLGVGLSLRHRLQWLFVAHTCGA